MYVRLVIAERALKPQHALINGEHIFVFEVEDWFGAHTSMEGKKELWDFRLKIDPEDVVEVHA